MALLSGVSDRLRLVGVEVRRHAPEHHCPRSLTRQRHRVQVRQQLGHKGSVDAKTKIWIGVWQFPLFFGPLWGTSKIELVSIQISEAVK